jgi:FixJ family two-component response regulator
MTVEVVQKGAVTVLEKPYAEDDLWDAMRKALEYDREQRAIHQRMAVNRRRLESLTESENEVLKLVMGGLPNKQVAVCSTSASEPSKTAEPQSSKIRQ